MNKSLIVFLLAFIPYCLIAQNKTSFTFEEATVPTDWVAQTGSLSISKNHYKEGVQSLCWQTQGESILEVSTRQFATKGLTTYMQLRTTGNTEDILIVEFLDGSGVIRRTANVTLNFNGWNEFNRAYDEYSLNPDFSLAKVRFKLQPTQSTTSRTLFIDNVIFNSPAIAKNFGSMWVLDATQFKRNNLLLSLFANPVDIAVTTPTQEELDGLALLRSRLPRVLTSPVNLLVARGLANKYAITRNDDGSVKGKPINCGLNELTNTFVNQHLQALETLGASSVKNSADSILFLNLLDHLLDQGFAQGTNFSISSSNYTDARYICTAILNLTSYVSDDRKIELLKLCRWLSEYGTAYFPENTYLSQFNSDLIYNYLPHYYGYAIWQPDPAIAVRELKALKRYLERHTEVVPGTSDMIKIDGTGFHHWTHYNNYMYAYKTWVEYICYLEATPFNINTPSYLRLREAVLATYMMANKNIPNGNHFWANSLAGRNPYTRGGIHVQVPLATTEGLITAGGEILGTGVDKELAAAYNYFTNTQKYDVPAINFDGYYQYNYSPLGIYRRANWVASMRAPTSYFWGAEIYSKQNRFGRYQSHGSLEIVYDGTYARSGIPTTAGSGGWDWNIVPGTTTVHYDSWTEMTPGKNLTQRFDQKSKGTDFSGALAFGNNGVFATEFLQGDNWGNQVFSPTNLKFKKSVFTFDSIFVALGTDISASGSYGADLITATNLFQEIKSPLFNDFIINGNNITDGYINSLASNTQNWMVTPLGTGYYIPNGNDEIQVQYASQKSPKETGEDVSNPTTQVTAVKAYIKHGKQPTNKSYQFVVVPATNAMDMSSLVTKMGTDGGSIYKVEAQTNTLHAVTYKPSNTTGYAFFSANSDLTFGEIISTTSEHLLMVKKELANNRLILAITNPNLRPQSDETFGFLSQPTTTTLTIRGIWKSISQTEGIKSITIEGTNTKIVFVLSEGMAEYLTLGDLADAIENNPSDDMLISLSQTKDILTILLPKGETKKKITLINADGRLIKQDITDQEHLVISTESFTKGLYILEVQVGTECKRFKVIL